MSESRQDGGDGGGLPPCELFPSPDEAAAAAAAAAVAGDWAAVSSVDSSGISAHAGAGESFAASVSVSDQTIRIYKPIFRHRIAAVNSTQPATPNNKSTVISQIVGVLFFRYVWWVCFIPKVSIHRTDTNTRNPIGSCFSVPKSSVRLTWPFALILKNSEHLKFLKLEYITPEECETPAHPAVTTEFQVDVIFMMQCSTHQ